MVRAMSYVLVATKSVPRPTDEGSEEPHASETDQPETEEPVVPPTDDGRQWAGDEYTEGDETDPAQARAAFTGEAGEAWLDRAEDGTLTGWVREPDGTVFRYADVDAWAIDVDGADIQTPLGQGQAVREVEPELADEEPGEEDDHPAFGL